MCKERTTEVFDVGKSHGRKIKKSEKSATNLEKSANPVPKSEDF